MYDCIHVHCVFISTCIIKHPTTYTCIHTYTYLYIPPKALQATVNKSRPYVMCNITCYEKTMKYFICV